ncbi:Ribosome-binding protein 1 [Babesia bigemina]|uniref:Ribosome-binding protein 1 n=1 Tax=Babesia bigemina TaxID=5866 RepID=A0A061DAZ4_BABBI|nr:Ribosome-binding protein 1 [Babesia bigemina]CDR94890.1 Ribosome-binding protein 1 [Babesia bigemina]|eukprot:XP_012767076.1 Ribosome-binding protein 1 [Babesia bigemina]
MAAKGNIPEFRTLKECLQFLEWLKNDGGMQGQVASRLVRLLKSRYKDAKQSDIESALSRFVGHVSNFHKKLCTFPRSYYNGHNSATRVLKSLLACIPKFLAVMYFLRYQVDDKFSAVGGGKWANLYPGWFQWFKVRGGELDAYLHDTSNENKYGVIPGGFDTSEVKRGGEYAQGFLMSDDLKSICEKHGRGFNVFLDVFVTSVFGDHGSDIPNVANALRLVEDFCKIFEDTENENAFRMDLESRGKCIDWPDLKGHCATLKKSLGKIYKEGAFSFTGYGREYTYLNKNNIDRKMAKWLKKHLHDVRSKLSRIVSQPDVNKFATTSLFPYGFTFYDNDFKNKGNPYPSLRGDWDAAIRELMRHNDGLEKLKTILDGNECLNRKKDKKPESKLKPGTQSEPEPEPEPEPELESSSESEDDLDSESEDENSSEPTNEITRIEAAKPVVTKAEDAKAETRMLSATQGKKSEGAQNQGKKAEGAQNQGKKAEGAQNQGKKAEGGQNQNGQSEGTAPSKEVGKTSEAHTSTAKEDLGPPGSKGDQGSQGSSDPLSQADSTATNRAPSMSDSTADRHGGGGLGGDGTENRQGPQAEKTTSPVPQCSNGKISSSYLGGGNICFSMSDITDENIWDAQRQGMLENEYKALQEQQLQRQSRAHRLKHFPQLSRPDPSPYPQSTGLRYDNERQSIDFRRNVGQGEDGIQSDIYADGVAMDETYFDPQLTHNNADKIRLDGSEKLDHSGLKRQLDEEQRRQDAEDQWGKYYKRRDEVRAEMQKQGEVIKRYETEAENKYKSEARTQEIIERIRKQNDKKMEAAQNLDKKYEQTTQEIWKTQLQRNVEHIINSIDDPDAQNRLQQKRLRQQKISEHQTISAYPPTSTPSTLPSQPSRPDPGLTPQPTGGRNSNGRGYYELGEWRPRHEVSSATNMLPSDFIAFAIPDTSSKQLEEEKQKRAKSDKQRLKLKRRTEEMKFSDKQHDAWQKEVVKLGEANKKWKRQQKDVERLEQLYNYGKRQQEKRKAKETKMENLLGWAEEQNKMNEEAERKNQEAYEERQRQLQQLQSDYAPLLSGTPVADLRDFIPDGEAVPDESYREMQKEEERRAVEHKAYENSFHLQHAQGRDRLNTFLLENNERIEPNLASIDGVPQAVVESQTNDIRRIIDMDFAVHMSEGLDGGEIKDESQNTGEQEHQRNVQLAEYDKTVELQRDMQQQWEKYSQDQSIKTKRLQQEHIQEVQRTLDAIKHFKDVEYQKQRAAAESLSGQPIISKSISSLPKMPNYANKPTFSMATGAPIRNPNPHSISIPTAMFLAEPQPTRGLYIDVPDRPPPKFDDPEFFIEVAKHTLPDNHLDFDLDFDDDSTHIRNDTPPDLVDPSFPAISFNIPPPGPEQYLPPSENPKINTVEFKDTCAPAWITHKITPSSPYIPETELFPSQAPRTVRDMLQWLAGLQNRKHHDTLEKCIEKAFTAPHSDASQLALSVNHANIRPTDVFDILQLTAMFARSVLAAIAPNWKASVSLKTVKPKSSEEPDCCALLCQLRDYAYACHYQLQFLKAQCSRGKIHGGWQDCKYGSDITASKSPLQAFLTDNWDSDFETHPFDPCNPCLKSRVRMGFRKDDLPEESENGITLSSILTPSCGGEDPLLTLCSYLNCITRRTPRTTGELVSFFHNFGNELYGYASESLSSLGNSLSTPHDHCPDWDHLKNSDLQAVSGIRGSESLKSNSNHDNEHPRTLSTLVGCGSDSATCHPRCSPITYRAYALYSQSFAHTYLSWAVYLPDRLWESLQKLHYDLKKHVSIKCSSLHLCSTAPPLLYTHGFTPPEVGLQPPFTCQQIISKLEEIVNGKPIASLMTAMDAFLYGIREPFIFTLVSLCYAPLRYFVCVFLGLINTLHICGCNHFTNSSPTRCLLRPAGDAGVFTTLQMP